MNPWKRLVIFLTVVSFCGLEQISYSQVHDDSILSVGGEGQNKKIERLHRADHINEKITAPLAIANKAMDVPLVLAATGVMAPMAFMDPTGIVLAVLFTASAIYRAGRAIHMQSKDQIVVVSNVELQDAVFSKCRVAEKDRDRLKYLLKVRKDKEDPTVEDSARDRTLSKPGEKETYADGTPVKKASRWHRFKNWSNRVGHAMMKEVSFGKWRPHKETEAEIDGILRAGGKCPDVELNAKAKRVHGFDIINAIREDMVQERLDLICASLAKANIQDPDNGEAEYEDEEGGGGGAREESLESQEMLSKADLKRSSIIVKAGHLDDNTYNSYKRKRGQEDKQRQTIDLQGNPIKSVVNGFDNTAFQSLQCGQGKDRKRIYPSRAVSDKKSKSSTDSESYDSDDSSSDSDDSNSSRRSSPKTRRGD